MKPTQVQATDWQILQVVHRVGSIPQHRLADLTGRSRSTINSAVQRLLSSDWLIKVGQETDGPGRPAILLSVNRSMGYFVGVDIGAEEVQLALVGADGTLLDQISTGLGTEHSFEAVLDQVDVTLHGLMARNNGDVNQLLGVWSGITGVVDDHGNVVTSASLGWHNCDLAQALKDRYECDVLVQGGASVMNAAAESLMGVGRDAENLVYYHAGRGISARFMQKGRPLLGSTRRAGEIGHVVVDPDGPQCVCGNVGCLEAVASGRALAAAIRRIDRSQLPESVRELLDCNEKVHRQEIIETAFSHVSGDGPGNPYEPLATLMTRTTRYLALGAAMAIAAYDPDVLVLGGYLFENNLTVYEGVRKLLETMVLDWPERNLKIVQGEVMSRNRAVGGAAEICQRLWANPRGIVPGKE